MDKTQLVSIELTTLCNLAAQHAQCPNRSPERYRHVDTRRELDDNTILAVVKSLYLTHGFRGLIAWHYYCEPLMASDRMFGLMRRIINCAPQARFLLWTNGTLLPKDLEPFKAFSRIVVTDYGNTDRERVNHLASQQPGVSVHSWPLDARMVTAGPPSTRPCARMFTEMIIDTYGNIHACCFDWQGRATLGNVIFQPLDKIVAKWRHVRDAVAGKAMGDDAPSVCVTCPHRSPTVAAILPPVIACPEAAEAARDYIASIRATKPEPAVIPEPHADAAKRKVAVVFVSYLKVPEERLRDHFAWNDATYKASGARVYVVMEKYRKLPAYATPVVYPQRWLPKNKDGKHVFSLCATKNAGIRRALSDGAEVVIVADVDHAFPPECWRRMVSVENSTACVPTYKMVPSLKDESQGHIDTGATGVISMTAANWSKIQWDERCVAYGADDGTILADIRKAGLRMDRDAIVLHVKHPGTVFDKNIPGHGRDGCYGRDGFNPDNFEENHKITLERLKKQ